MLASAIACTALASASPASAAPATVTINIASGQPDPTSTSPVRFTVTFSKAVTGFDAADVDLSSSTVGGTLVATVTGGPSVYTVSVSGMTTAGSVIASIPAGAAIDASSNASTASTSTDNSFAWFPDTTAPTVTIDQAASQADPTSTSPVLFTATFSEPVTKFDAADVLLASSTAGGALAATVTGGPSIYTVDVAGMSTAGNVIASIRAGAAIDAASNASAVSTSTDNSVAWLPAVKSPSTGLTGITPKASLTVLSSCRPHRPCLTEKGGTALPLKVECQATLPCMGAIAITAASKGAHAASQTSKQKPITLGRLRFTVAAGAKRVLRIPLATAARQLLGVHSRVKAILAIALGPTPTLSPIAFALPRP
jgi:hypothetical protein